MRIDFHTHTTRGSADSNLDAFAMIDQAQKVGLEGLCITEHDNAWDDPKIDEYANKHGVTLFRGIEVTTEWGHVGTFGLNRHVHVCQRRRGCRRHDQSVRRGAGYKL